MAIVDAISKAILRVDGAQVQTVFSSSDQIALEMADLANEVATDISRSHDWRGLTKIAVVTGNGGTTYPLPTDYDRMTKLAEVDAPAGLMFGYQPIGDVNEWMRYMAGQHTIRAPGGWIIIGGDLHFWPAPSGNAQFPYVSRYYVKGQNGTAKAQFTRDDDDFVLDPRLLTLALVWRWRAQKGMEYAEDMETFELALSQAQARDRGSYVIRQGSPVFAGVRRAL